MTTTSGADLEAPAGRSCTRIGCTDYVRTPFFEARPRAHTIEFAFDGKRVVCRVTAAEDRAGSSCDAKDQDPLFVPIFASSGGFTIGFTGHTPQTLRVTVLTRGEPSESFVVNPQYELHYPNGRDCGSPCRHGLAPVVTIASPSSRGRRAGD